MQPYPDTPAHRDTYRHCDAPGDHDHDPTAADPNPVRHPQRHPFTHTFLRPNRSPGEYGDSLGGL